MDWKILEKVSSDEIIFESIKDSVYVGEFENLFNTVDISDLWPDDDYNDDTD